MARWKLSEGHYLKVPDTFWEQKEIDRGTGKQIIKKYPVPLHLDPKIEDDWNYGLKRGEVLIPPDPDFGSGIIVCFEGKGKPRDIVFQGTPTPGMIPLDDEAKEISSKYSWKAPLDELSPTFSEMKLADFQNELAIAYSKVAGPSNEIQSQLADAIAQMAKMMEIQTMLLQKLAMPAMVASPEGISRL